MLTEHGTRIAPSTYYAAIKRGPSKRELSDRKMIDIITKLHKKNFSVYGVHKMWKELLRKAMTSAATRSDA